MSEKKKIIRTATIPLSLNIFCRGLLSELSEEYDIVAVTSPGEGFDKISRREGVRTIAVPMQRSISPWRDCIALLTLIRVLRAERPAMVHSITPKAGLLSMLAAWVVGVPVRVHTFTGLIFPTATGARRRLLMLTDRITCFCATHILPEGEGIKHDLQRFGITRKPMCVLGHGNLRGIDLHYYDRTFEVMVASEKIRASLAVSAGTFIFIFAGRIVADKGIRELMYAFERLAGECAGVQLLLLGGREPELSSLDAKTQERMSLLSAAGYVHVVEWQEDLRPWYTAADALVFPSYREGFPNVVIEAGAMGLPCIVTDINGSREIIRQGENGMILSPHDGDALYRAMKMFVEHPEKTSSMGACARPLIAARYEQSYVRGCLKDFYYTVLR